MPRSMNGTTVNDSRCSPKNWVLSVCAAIRHEHDSFAPKARQTVPGPRQRQFAAKSRCFEHSRQWKPLPASKRNRLRWSAPASLRPSEDNNCAASSDHPNARTEPHRAGPRLGL